MDIKYCLITKDQERSKNLENILKTQNYEVYFAPLFDVKYQAPEFTSLEFGAVIVTSANAIKALNSLNIDKEIEIFSVGKITTLELQEVGFKNIKTAPNQNANSLKELIISDYKLNKKLLYLCGDKITLDFQKELFDFGINVEKYVSYKTSPNTEIKPEIANIRFDYILVFSKYSAQIFLKLTNENKQLKDNFKLAKILCLSNKIADEFKNSDFKNIGNFSELEILKKHYL